MKKQSHSILWIAVLFTLTFSQDQEYPWYSEEELPKTSFSCRDKQHGGYYADTETGCLMYHVCARQEDGVMKDTKFLCGNGTVFDQRHLVCQDDYKVPYCQDSVRYYRRPAVRVRYRVPIDDGEDIREGYYPTYSEDDLPQTRFTCRDKVNGGYYADVETDCQMYHICSKDKFGFMRSTRFLCGNGTVFDQRHLVCQDYKKVRRCRDSARYYKVGSNLLSHLETLRRREDKDAAILRASNFEFDRLN